MMKRQSRKSGKGQDMVMAACGQPKLATFLASKAPKEKMTQHAAARSPLIFPNTTSSDLLRLLQSLDARYSLHSARRGAACNLASLGVAMTEIQQFLGHQDVSTTYMYVDAAPHQPEMKRHSELVSMLQ